MAVAAAVESTQNPRLRLLLDNPLRGDGLGSTAVVWSPASILQGTLEIVCVRSFEVDEAAIFLEGISRNWMVDAVGNEIALRVSTAERKFLSQTLDVPLSTMDQATATPDGYRLAVSFHFVVSNIITGSTAEPPLQCLRLPPSIELGKVYVEDSSGKRFAQPSISYHLRAVVNFAERGQDPAYNAETSIPIVIMPHTEELPPTDTHDFPAEFKLRESRMIRWSSLGRSLGIMAVSMQEPRALTYDLSSTGASTVAVLNLEVEPNGAYNAHQGLQAMSFTLLSLLRVKTFYSIKAFPQVPSQSLLTVYGGTRLRDDMIKLETQNVPNVSWGYTYDIIEDDKIGEATQSGGQSFRPATKSNPHPPQGKWTAKISYPIRVDCRLLPTFCSSIVARLYSVILRVKVSGIKKESFDLETPLQVVHTSPDALSSESIYFLGASAGLAGEDPSLLEFRRASTTSWFSNESLENEESPPRYYP